MRAILSALSVCLLSGASLPAAADDALLNGPRIAVPAHDIERGEVIQDSDLVIARVAAERMRPGIVMAKSELAGHEARRLLHGGDPVRAEDVRMPILVAKGSAVTMTFEEPGISLTATGRAIGEGGLGETIAVQNPVSFRQVSCVVTGPGTVRAGDATPLTNKLAANTP